MLCLRCGFTEPQYASGGAKILPAATLASSDDERCHVRVPPIPWNTAPLNCPLHESSRREARPNAGKSMLRFDPDDDADETIRAVAVESDEWLVFPDQNLDDAFTVGASQALSTDTDTELFDLRLIKLLVLHLVPPLFSTLTVSTS
mmetsp:Transcript_16869/g.54538  ORF Transcript_16869/g.54538 Transcript_16869/m.54538 type:complete len:146 (+) Transcript_16869:132-569(+)